MNFTTASVYFGYLTAAPYAEVTHQPLGNYEQAVGTDTEENGCSLPK
jgi:hypothetical protein